LVTILAGGIGGGIQTMATLIPPIGFMFLFLSFLEDSGYMAKAAFVMDRFTRVIGLPAKSFIPMLVGFGCNVPAIMATRTQESERDRTLTIMMNPFMSCGARLPVYAFFATAFFPTGGQILVFLLYLIGIGLAVLTGLVLKNTLLKRYNQVSSAFL
jgi:ferrous iron transport protein B